MTITGIISGVLAIIYKISPSLIQFAQNELMVELGFQDELKKISTLFGAIGLFLQDAEARQIQDASVTSWLQKLEELAYEMDDFLEDLILDPQPGFFPASQAVVVSLLYFPFYSYPKFLIFRIKFGSRLNEISKRLAILDQERDRYQFREMRNVNRIDRSTYSHVDDTSIFGREEDKEILVHKLIKLNRREGNHKPVPVISIVGMGGIGKTTLTQLVYNEDRVKQHFEMCLWVCVSDDFNVKEIMRKILEEGGVSSLGITELQSLSRRLISMLEGKRYLLILDDVWNEEYTKWDKLKLILNCGARESKIIVTTRKPLIAENIGSDFIHKLQGLQSDACWLIFEKIAFGRRRIFEGLENIGRKIIEKCQGLPLAVKTLASMLRDKSSVECWTDVLNSDIWTLPQSGVDIVPALLLSYLDLPPHLKPCFGYCSIFPKNTKLFKDELVRLWAAQGYVVDTDGRESEDIGEEYFYELLDLSFFQEQEEDEDETGSVVCCKMHDLFHDVAKYVTSGKCSSFIAGAQIGAMTMKGSVVHCRIVESERGKETSRLPSWLTESCARNVRTLMLLESEHWLMSKLDFNQLPGLRVLSLAGTEIDDARLGDIGNLVHLRYLDLSWTGISVLPNSFAKLVFLIYLDLSFTDIADLPNWIGGLQFLQTIKLKDCMKLKCLAKELHGLERLKHLDISGRTINLKDLPSYIGRLTGLRTLSMFPVAKKQDESTILNLGSLNNLRRELEIRKLENVTSRTEAVNAQLEKKQFLRRLCLEWSKNSLYKNHKEALEGLRPPPNLRRLAIRGYGGDKFASWIDGRALAVHIFSNVTHIELADCPECDDFPASLGRLPRLKRLKIHKLVKVKKVGCELYHFFPTLEELELSNMDSWELWDGEEKLREAPITMPRLRRLSIDSCPLLRKIPPIYSASFRELCISSTPIESLRDFLPTTVQSLQLGNSSKVDCVDTIKLLHSFIMPLQELHTLEIANDPKLICFPRNIINVLPALRSLVLVNCSNMTSLPTGVERIRLRKMPTRRLLEQSSRIPGLKYLAIEWDDELTQLPEQLLHLTSLVELSLSFCSDLVTLPARMSLLTELKVLRVNGCSTDLENKCYKGGLLWPYIAHIPNIIINE